MDNNQNIESFLVILVTTLFARMFSCFHSWIKYPLRLSRLHHFHALNIAWKLIHLHPRFETGALSTVCSSVEDG